MRDEMPIYEYECKCGKIVELERKLSQRKDPVTCPNCGKFAIQIISGCGFALMGSGWASSGYASPKPRNKKGK